MIKRFSHFFPIMIVALLAAATYWLEFVVRSEAPTHVTLNKSDPDAYVHNFSVDRFGVDGKLQSHLTAQLMVHYPVDDSAKLDAPQLTFNRPPSQMHMRSDHATASNDTRQVVMEGNVVVDRKPNPTAIEQHLTTETLTVLTDDEIALTESPLVITQGSTRIEGTGAEWNNVRGTLRMDHIDATLTSPGAAARNAGSKR